MITIVTGPPGNGKSLLEQSDTVDEWRFTDRPIVTSTPVRFDPWVTDDGRTMMGLTAYCRHILKITVPKVEIIRPGVSFAGKLLVVEDESELASLFMWRYDMKKGEWFKVRWDPETEQFNREDLSRVNVGQLIITDEAWKCYSSRRWKDAEKVTEFYGRQHRKFGDDWHLVSHSHKDLDVQLNRMAQQWKICTNYGLRRLGLFRQPSVFEVKTFYEPPSSHTARAMHTAIRRLDVRIAQTYDTSAGVAVGGGRGADVKRRKKGLHIGWLIAGVVLIVAVLVMLPKMLGGGFQYMLRKALGFGPAIPVQKSNSSVPIGSSIGKSNSITSKTERLESLAAGNPGSVKVQDTNEVLFCGYYVTKGQIVALLSDDTMRLATAFRVFPDGSAFVNDRIYQRVRLTKSPALPFGAVPLPPALPIPPGVSDDTVEVTTIGRREETSQPPTMRDNWITR